MKKVLSILLFTTIVLSCRTVRHDYYLDVSCKSNMHCDTVVYKLYDTKHHRYVGTVTPAALLDSLVEMDNQ